SLRIGALPATWSLAVAYALPLTSFPQTPPSRPRASAHSRASVFDLRDAESERPHPRRSHRRRVHLEDAADDSAVSEHVEIVVAPLARRARGRGALEDEGAFYGAHPKRALQSCSALSSRSDVRAR